MQLLRHLMSHAGEFFKEDSEVCHLFICLIEFDSKRQHPPLYVSIYRFQMCFSSHVRTEEMDAGSEGSMKKQWDVTGRWGSLF